MKSITITNIIKNGGNKVNKALGSKANKDGANKASKGSANKALANSKVSDKLHLIQFPTNPTESSSLESSNWVWMPVATPLKNTN
jgi:hypothetical protein